MMSRTSCIIRIQNGIGSRAVIKRNHVQTSYIIRLSARDYDAITRTYNVYHIRGMVGGAGGGGIGDGLPMVSRVSL